MTKKPAEGLGVRSVCVGLQKSEQIGTIRNRLGSGLELNLTRSPLMKIEIQSIKITFKWWQPALIIAVIILSFKAPELVIKLFQMCFSSG
jgi:hypothetical protein